VSYSSPHTLKEHVDDENIFQYLKYILRLVVFVTHKTKLPTDQNVYCFHLARHPFPIAEDWKRTCEDQRVTYTSPMSPSRKAIITPVGVVGKVLRILELLDRSPAGVRTRKGAAT
jgi:hypothetical protein